MKCLDASPLPFLPPQVRPLIPLTAIAMYLRAGSRCAVGHLVIGLVVWGFATGERAGGEERPDRSRLHVEIDFPGGSADVQEIDQAQRLIRLLPSDHVHKGWRCWWYLKVTGLTEGELLQVQVGDAPWATPDQAALSHDNQTWTQTEPGTREGKTITYQIRSAGESLYLAWGPPMVAEGAESLIAAAAEKPYATRFVLTKSKEGREVPALRIHQASETLSSEPIYGIWIQARQHAWESGSSWVCRGVIEWLVSDDPRAERLRKQAEIYIVPIMDLDSVELGAGGKNQTPHDHNRDWSSMPHWPETAAAMAKIGKLNEEHRFELFVDLHNPGATTKEPFFFVAPRESLSEIGLRNLDRFLAAAREDMTGPLAFTGQTIESGANYDPQWQRISKNWVNEQTRSHTVALTLETAWNTPHSNTTGYRIVGAQLGSAMERYLRLNPRQ